MTQMKKWTRMSHQKVELGMRMSHPTTLGVGGVGPNPQLDDHVIILLSQTLSVTIVNLSHYLCKCCTVSDSTKTKFWLSQKLRIKTRKFAQTLEYTQSSDQYSIQKGFHNL